MNVFDRPFKSAKSLFHLPLNPRFERSSLHITHSPLILRRSLTRKRERFIAFPSSPPSSSFGFVYTTLASPVAEISAFWDEEKEEEYPVVLATGKML